MKERRMDSSVFNRLLDELDGNSLKTLKEKNARYSRNNDSLHNFRAGASITGKTPAETCWGYASKHLIALRDMIDANDFSNREDFLEKCQDAINYIRFIWCIGNDEEYWKAKDKPIAGEIDVTKNLPKTVTVYCNGKVCKFFNNVDEVISDEDGFTVYLTDPNMLPYRYIYDIDKYTYEINNRKDK